jgi:hypothetical protein
VPLYLYLRLSLACASNVQEHSLCVPATKGAFCYKRRDLTPAKPCTIGV